MNNERTIFFYMYKVSECFDKLFCNLYKLINTDTPDNKYCTLICF